MKEKQKMNKEKIQITLITFIITILFIFIVSNIIYLNQENVNYGVNDLKLDFYGDISDAYQDDKEVIKVYELCLDSEIKTVCVYENIKFSWSESFEVIRKDYFFSPTEMVKYNGRGVCRDIAVFRMAVFKKLNIHAEFVFIPGHVYLKTFEKGEVYELDNGFMRKNET